MFYTDDERLIYTTPGGRRLDPLAVHRRLVVASGGRLNEHLSVWSSESASDVERAMAEEQVVAVARAAFDVQPFGDGGGGTDAEALDHLEHYLRWCEGKDLRAQRRLP